MASSTPLEAAIKAVFNAWKTPCKSPASEQVPYP